MSSLPSKTFAFVNAARAASTQHALDDCFEDYLRELNYKAWVCARMSVEPKSVVKPFTTKDFSRSDVLWLAHYKSEGYAHEDPLVHALLTYDRAFYWSEIVKPDQLNKRQKRIYDEAADIGFRSGIVVPLRIWDGSIYAMSVSGPNEFEDAEIRDGVSIASQFYLGHALSLTHKPAKLDVFEGGKVLSRRERQVVGLVRRGYRYAAIASELGISVETVDFTIANARKRYHALTNAQLVADAIQAGEITPDGEPA